MMPSTFTPLLNHHDLYAPRKNISYPKKPAKMAPHALYHSINILADAEPMDPTYKLLFTAALRSKLYHQIRGAFREGQLEHRWKIPCMCATGVLCDIIMPNNGAWTHTDKLRGSVTTYWQKAKISQKTAGALITLNDCGFHFSTIANIVDQYL